ncbi:UbiA family prenyltransferase [Pseudoduganella violacea]|uniref:4-hydroxybenzoate polyprenyltransferase n=1 Tax=Pseudoduganella violacea TaxID=1715466 RepID=A0A7W5BGK1_9BURK|nr:UbiA family prenyltransferase [Pseudoduganella violacea]MBB3121845.1 4-hydroxybenzoate polyprenyltransferase [Pseudoduganella violacea]
MNTLIRKAPALGVYLRLGRVSNLPTVWTNVLAGTVLGGGGAAAFQPRTALVMAAISAFYLAGMYLNDAFDRAIDARERPSRPIPAGEISAAAVFCTGFALLALGLFGLALCGAAPVLSGCALAACILLYDVWHKGNPASPLVMGVCRALVYLAAGAAAAAPQQLPGAALAAAGLAVLAHVAGLTYAAKQESLDRMERLWPLAVLAIAPLAYAPAALDMAAAAMLLVLLVADVLAVRLLRRRAARGDVGRAVAQLIAAISLLDGLILAAAGAPLPLLAACVTAYGATRLLQRVIPGT